MSLIFLATVLLNLAFSANVTNVRKLLGDDEEEHEDHSFVTTETCEGICKAELLCGMPTELANLFAESVRKNKKKRRPTSPYRPGPYFPYQMFPGMMMQGMMPYGGMMGGYGGYGGFPYFGEEETEGQNRRLLDAKATPGCADSRLKFLRTCKKLRRCGAGSLKSAPKSCPEIAKAGMCNRPVLAAACCASCGGCKNELPLTAAFPDGCKGLTKELCENPTGDEGIKCAKTCSLGFGVDKWCSDETVGTCVDRRAVLNQKCLTYPQFQLCGMKTSIKNCKQAAAAGWCSKANLPWVRKVCAKSCGACMHCADHECPKGYTHKVDEMDNTDVSDETCCIADDKICSCDWQCMFNDNCCEDYSEQCCK